MNEVYLLALDAVGVMIQTVPADMSYLCPIYTLSLLYNLYAILALAIVSITGNRNYFEIVLSCMRLFCNL